jgi:hypothetical protein
MESEFKEMMIYMGKYYKLNREIMSSQEKQYEEDYDFDFDDFYTDLVREHGRIFVRLMDYNRLNSISNHLKRYIEDFPTLILDDIGINKKDVEVQ